MIVAKTESIRTVARWAGALNLICAFPDGFSVSTLRKLIVLGDPAATAAHVLGSEALFRLAVVADLFGLLLFIASGVWLYSVFRPAGPRVAIFYLVIIAMGTLAQALALMHTMGGLALLQAGAGAGALPAAQANALAIVEFKLYSQGYQLGLFFDAVSSLIMGTLIVRSTFMPRLIGPLMWLDGMGGLIFSLGGFLSPTFVKLIYPYIPFATVLVGEGTFYLWLVIKGVNAGRWREQAALR
jgi:uncharacterized protein DUF4386